MAKLTNSASEKSQSLDDHIQDVIQNISVTTDPVVVCGVQRKANIGNFENIDIYCAVALPLTGLSLEDRAVLTDAVVEAAQYGFNITSSETLARYKVVKNIDQ